MADAPQPISVLASNRVVGVPDGNIFSWCPQMDILAVSMNHMSIWMFRLDGERVYSINNRARILHLCWSSSGTFFAVSGSDHVIKVYESNTGRLVNMFAATPGLPISLASWHTVDVEKSVAGAGPPSVFQDMFHIEVLQSMPKLSYEVPATDSLGAAAAELNPDKHLDFLLVASGDSQMSMTFNNLFTVANIELPAANKLLRHAMGPDLFTQQFLVQNGSSQLLLQDATLQIDTPRLRNLLIKTVRFAAQLLALDKHIADQLAAVSAEAAEFIALFDRYLANYKDALLEGETVDLLEAQDRMIEDLGDMLFMGTVPEHTTDYWLNQFGERGLMRLSSLGNNVYDNVRRTLFTQHVLALEKMVVILTYLSGITRAAGFLKEDDFGIDLLLVEAAISHTLSLLKSVYDLIWKLNKEQQGFNEFLNWCKIEVIEMLAKSSSGDLESFVREHPSVDVKASELMEYFDCRILEPVLLNHLNMADEKNEVLKRSNVKSEVLQHSNAVHKAVEELLDSIKSFVAKKVSISEPVDLGLLGTALLADIELFGNVAMVSSVLGSVLSVVIKKLGELRCGEFHLASDIIDHKIIDTNSLLVLRRADKVHRLDLIDVTFAPDNYRVTKSLQLSLPNPKHLTLNNIQNRKRVIGSVLDESKKDYVVFEL